MTKIPTSSLINRYNDVSTKCKQIGEPIYVTKNGKVDLIVISIKTFERRQALLELKERLLDIELEQTKEAKYYSLEELDSALKEIVGDL